MANSAVEIVFSSEIRFFFLLSFFYDLLMVAGFAYPVSLLFHIQHKLPDHLNVANSCQLPLEKSWPIKLCYISLPFCGLGSKRRRLIAL